MYEELANYLSQTCYGHCNCSQCNMLHLEFSQEDSKEMNFCAARQGAAAIRELNSIRHGQWILSMDELTASCSECGTSFPCWRMWPANFCPNCGARMDKEKNIDG